MVFPGAGRPAPRRERWWLHLLLLAATLFTVSAAGATLQGLEAVRLGSVPLGPTGLAVPLGVEPRALREGLRFSLPLLAILLAHELGHFVAGRLHRMDVSPPFFVPAPHWLNAIGTFGAFIRLRSALPDRRVLLDVGAAGPLAGFAVALPVAAVGLAHSAGVAVSGGNATGFLVVFGDAPVRVGGSVLFAALASVFAPRAPALLLHPWAFAGWLGFFVTALNLFPLSQLDGGHVLYALGGRLQRGAAWAFLLVLLALGRLWSGWWFWAAIILLLGRGRLVHPGVRHPWLALAPGRRAIAWACVLLFLLTFVPVPFRI